MIPVSALLQNVSDEVTRLARIAEALDEIVGDLAASESIGSATLLAGFQDVDALRQSLHAIAQVTLLAARDIPESADAWLPKGPLAEGITLEKVRDACLRTERKSDAETREEEREAAARNEPSFFDEF